MCYQINKIIFLMLLLEAAYTSQNIAVQQNSSQTAYLSCPIQNFWLKCHSDVPKFDKKSESIEQNEEPKKEQKKEKFFYKLFTTVFKTIVALFVKQFVQQVLKELLKELGKNVKNNYLKTLLELCAKTSITVISSIFSDKLSRLAIQLVFRNIKKKITAFLGPYVFKGFTKAVIAKVTQGYSKVLGKKIKKKSRKLKKIIKKSEILKKSQEMYLILQENEAFKSAKKSCKFIMKGKFKKFMKKKKKKLIKRAYTFVRSQQKQQNDNATEELIQNSMIQTQVCDGKMIRRRQAKKKINNKKIQNHGTAESYSFGVYQGEQTNTFCKVSFAVSNFSKFLFGLFSVDKTNLPGNCEGQKLTFSQSFFSFSFQENYHKIIFCFSFFFMFFWI